MTVIISPKALAELRRLTSAQPFHLFVGAVREYEGGCGCETHLTLSVSPRSSTDIGDHSTDPAGEDDHSRAASVSVDPVAEDILGPSFQIHYRPGVGYSLANDEQTVAYGLSVKLNRADG